MNARQRRTKSREGWGKVQPERLAALKRLRARMRQVRLDMQTKNDRLRTRAARLLKT